MAWTNIANANLDVGAPIRSVDLLALRDNVSAVPNGDTGAPRIKAEALNGGQSGNAPIYAARAWVNFNGMGTVAIRASGNVSSITDNGTGNYTVNFTTAMPDTNYVMTGSANSGASNIAFVNQLGTTNFNEISENRTTSAIKLIVRSDTGTATDTAGIFVSIFR